MAGLDLAAAALRELLGAAGFIRRDRARRALFVSDYPRRVTPAEADRLALALKAKGWQARVAAGLALLDMDIGACARFLQGLAPLPEHRLPAGFPGLLRIYARHEAALVPAMLPQIRAALLHWDAGEHQALGALAGAQLALHLRRKAPPNACFPALLAASADTRPGFPGVRHDDDGKEMPAC